MIALYVIAAILLLILIILILPVRAVLKFCADEKSVYLQILFVKIPLYPKTEIDKDVKKEAEHEEKQDEEREKKKGLPANVFELAWEMRSDIKKCINKLLQYFILHAVKIDKLNIYFKFGTGDPMYTGLVCGAVYPFVYNSAAMLEDKKILKKWYADIRPDFDSATLNASIYTVLKTRIFHLAVIIHIVLNLAIRFLILKRKKK